MINKFSEKINRQKIKCLLDGQYLYKYNFFLQINDSKNFCLEFVILNILQILKISMSSFIKNLKRKISAFDLFPSPVLLRYNTEQMVQSKTGGVISILIIITMIVVFYNSWISMLNKTTITSNMQIIRQNSPSKGQVINDQFLFAISLGGFQILNKSQQRYLDFQVTKQIRINGTTQISQAIPLVPCQREHFLSFGQEYGKKYDHLKLKNAACLPYNYTTNIEGKWGSQDFEYIRIHVKRCDVSDLLCKTNAQLQTYLQNYNAFYVNYFFLNKLINPTLIDPVSTVFQDKYYNMINDKIAIDTNIYLSQYQLNTDQSLLPTEGMNVTKGLYMDKSQKEQFIHPPSNGTYAQFFIRKSDNKIRINRKFIKLDELLSYLGGLFGIITTIFSFLISKYNKCCFQLQMCRKVFKTQSQNDESSQQRYGNNKVCQQNQQDPKIQKNKKQQDKQTDFNFWTFLKYTVYNGISSICPSFQWKSMYFLNEQFQQTQNQMNVDTLLQKISFYQRAFQCIFDQNQIMLLLLQDKLSIKQLKQQRILMNFEHYISNEKSLKKIIKQSAQDGIIMKKKKVSCELVNQPNVMGKRRSILAMQGLTQMQFTQHNIKNNQTLKQICNAIQAIFQKSKQGDPICRKILGGVRQDVMDRFQKDKFKQEKTMANHSLSLFGLVQQLNTPPEQKMLGSALHPKHIGMKIDFGDLSEDL